MKIKILVCFSVILVFACSLCYEIEDDWACLEGLKKSTVDPMGRLASWNFKNKSPGSICKLYGVSCWNETENRIISLDISSSELSGQLPESFKYCRSLTALDLSHNSFSGSIPPYMCDWLPYLVTLDISTNRLSGAIPPESENCVYLNTLVLNENDLSGSIPCGLSNLQRLTRFTVADNKLSGLIPAGLAKFSESDFDGNDGLCGKPLGKCGGDGLNGKSVAIIVSCGAGGTAFGLMVWGLLHCRRMGVRNRKVVVLNGDG